MHKRATYQTLPLLPALALLMLSSCTQHSSSAAAQAIPPQITLSGLPAPSFAAVATTTATTEAPSITEAPTTEAPTTEAPTTTDAEAPEPCPSSAADSGSASMGKSASVEMTGRIFIGVRLRVL